MRPCPWIVLPLLLSACASGGYAGNGWDGRRGYDGRGDYGYDVDASRAEAQGYRARASRSYPVPGSPDDPWGPYIREAATRYTVPERWIREVMRQESGGRLWSGDGLLTTSSVGAMGLMQVMPSTYDGLRRRYGLGGDAYEPHDNIMAGAAYIREMSDRFGSPAFLAAYNAGPDRVDAYLAGAAALPDETVNYLAQVAPHLGSEVAMTGPLASYAGGGVAVAMPATDRAYAGGGMTGLAYYAPSRVAGGHGGGDPADRAFDGGGLVTAAVPTGTLTGDRAQP
jgi:D-alanyl-D-alanine carboxypeptidase